MFYSHSCTKTHLTSIHSRKKQLVNNQKNNVHSIIYYKTNKTKKYALSNDYCTNVQPVQPNVLTQLTPQSSWVRIHSRAGAQCFGFQLASFSLSALILSLFTLDQKRESARATTTSTCARIGIELVFDARIATNRSSASARFKFVVCEREIYGMGQRFSNFRLLIAISIMIQIV